MSDLKSLTGLKNKVEKLRSKVDRARGAVGELSAELKSTWDCDSVEAAEKLLKSLQQQEKKKLSAYKKNLSAFEEKYAEELQDADSLS